MTGNKSNRGAVRIDPDIMNLILDEQARLRKAEGRKSTYSEIMRRMWEAYEDTKRTGTEESLQKRGIPGPGSFRLPQAGQVIDKLLSEKAWREQTYAEVDVVIDRTLKLIANLYAEAVITEAEASSLADEIGSVEDGTRKSGSGDRAGNKKNGKGGKRQGSY
jgi:hypothetical protein